MTGREQVPELLAAAVGERAFEFGHVLASRQYWGHWLSDVQDGCQPHELIRARNALGSLLLELGEFQDALQLFLLNRETLDGLSSDLAYERIRVDTNVSVARYFMGDVSGALQEIEAACAAACSETPPPILGRMYQQANIVSIAHQRWREAAEYGLRAVENYEMVGDMSGMAQALLNLGIAEAGMGQSAAIRRYEKAIDMAEAAGDYRTVAFCYTELARHALNEGAMRVAIESGREALRTLWSQFQSVDKAEVARLCEVFGRIALRSTDRYQGLVYLERASIYYAQSEMWREWAEMNGLIQEEKLALDASSGLHAGSSEFDLDLKEMEVLDYFTSLFALLDMMDGMYPGLKKTADLTTRYSLLLAETLGADLTQREVLSHASRLHDIGLTAVDREIVGAQGDISGAALRRIESHPVMGEQTLSSFPVPPEALAATRSHHENYDGTGYPDAIRGEAIPLAARILAVAEEYVEAVLRAHSEGHGEAHTAGLVRIRDLACTRLDPALVDAFIRMHEYDAVQSAGSAAGGGSSAAGVGGSSA